MAASVLRRFVRIAGLVPAIVLWLVTSAFADAAFDRWLESLWPQAQSLGVSRTTFDAATRGLEPDLKLPELVIPGRQETQRGQAEFVLTPTGYLKETTLAALAGQGRRLLNAHRATLLAVEKAYGVPGSVVLAIWARETAFGADKLPYSAVRTLATQAYLGRRKEMFVQEFLLALRLLEEEHVTLDTVRSSWAGAMGQPQFMPSDFFKYAVDFDGDGKRDIWNSVPDTLASIGHQLAGKGWVTGQPWAIEVRAPKEIDCTQGRPDVAMPIAEWLKRGFAPAYDRRVSAAERAMEASLLQPEGTYGPAFLTPKNYFALKDYNFSDLYVLFVGHLADRIARGKPFETRWSKTEQLRTAQVEAMQRMLTAKKFYDDKIDGKAGMLTRTALGNYQKANGLKIDCWPTQELLGHMQR